MFKKGDKVKLKKDVLQRHARSVPAHAGYSREQFNWRDTLRGAGGKVGKVKRTFPNSKHLNVQFGKTLIGIRDTEVEKVNKKRRI